MRLTNLPLDGIDKASINLMVSNYAKPRYVDYRKGTDFAVVRFGEKETADGFFEKYSKEDEKLLLKGNKVRILMREGHSIVLKILDLSELISSQAKCQILCLPSFDSPLL